MNLTLTDKPNFERDTFRQIAELHRNSLPDGFLPSLGTRFLVCLYRSIQQYPGGVLVSCQNGDRTVGFISGVDDVAQFYSWFLRHKLFAGAWSAMPGMISIRALRKTNDLLFYPRKARQSLPELPGAELVSLAVDPQFRRQGIARELYEALVEQFRQRGIMRFRIMVGRSQAAAAEFYKRMGARQVSQLEVHRHQATFAFVHFLEQRTVSAAGE
jgi:ribosomal protein S18 acetylase RimI-like enzyme